MQAERRDRVGRGKLPSRKDRLDDFEAVPDPVNASQQCCLVHVRSWRQRKLEDDFRLYSWLSETHERERIAYLGEIVYRAVVNISPDRFIDIVFGPNRAIRESPIFRPTGISPRASRICLIAAVTR